MAVSLPLSFSQCFSSGRGLRVLHQKVDANLEDNLALLRYLKAQTRTYKSIGIEQLGVPDFQNEDGASYQRAIQGLLQATIDDAVMYRRIANELERRLLEPFEAWTEDHANAMKEARRSVMSHIQALERALQEVNRAKTQYDSKILNAEEIENESDFHTSPQDPSDPKKITPLSIPTDRILSPLLASSPKALMTPDKGEEDDLSPVGISPVRSKDSKNGLNKRVSLANRLKALTRDPQSPALVSVTEDEDEQKLKDDTKIIEIATIKNGAKEWSSLFSQAAKEVPKRVIKIPLIGVYNDLHTGEDLVLWFKENVLALENDYLRAFEFARQLSEELLLLRLVGEMGNKFHDTAESFYQFRPEAFHLDNLEKAKSKSSTPVEEDSFTRLPGPASPRLRPSSPELHTPTLSQASAQIQAQTASLLKRSNTVLSSISSAFTPTSSSVRFQKAKQEASEACTAYKMAVRKAELLRMTADEQVEAYLHFVQRAQVERLGFLKVTLTRYQNMVAPLLPRRTSAKSIPAKPDGTKSDAAEATTSDEIDVLIESIQPEADIQALCELYRVEGGYRSQPVVFYDHYNETVDALFGGELTRWAEIQAHQGKNLEEIHVPPVLTVMLDYIKEGYSKLPNSIDKRRIWYLEVPLAVSHRLRQALNDARAPSSSSHGVPTNLLKQSDLPVVASVVKLFFLDLEQPIVSYQAYEDLRLIYQTLGSVPKDNKEADDTNRITALKEFLLRLPRINLICLDALVTHIRNLVVNTRSTSDPKIDSDEIYLSKTRIEGLLLGLARPRTETAVTISDKAPIYFFSDLVRLRDQILPETIAFRTKRETDRFRHPQRKRTRPVDMRLSRSKLGLEPTDSDSAHHFAETPRQGDQMLSTKSPENNVPASEKNLPHKPSPSPPLEKPTTASRLQQDPPSVPSVDPPTVSNGNEDPPFETPEASPEEELKAPIFSKAAPATSSSNPAKSTKHFSSPIALPRTMSYQSAAARPDSPNGSKSPARAISPIPVQQSSSKDPPFQPPSEEVDPPFSPPPDDDTAASPLSGESSNGKILSRAPRVNRGPRPFGDATIQSGRVAAAAQRFSTGSSPTESALRSKRDSRS